MANGNIVTFPNILLPVFVQRIKKKHIQNKKNFYSKNTISVYINKVHTTKMLIDSYVMIIFVMTIVYKILSYYYIANSL